MRKAVIGGSLIALILPVATYAATSAELRAQIEALLKQVEALQQQVQGSVQTGGGTGAGGGAAAPGAVPANFKCPYISRVLKRGASGADVTRLQQFLALDPSIYPEAAVTGYYGALTEAAIKRFQCKNKLVCDGTPETTGYGVTGPRTAALLALQCPDTVGGAGANVGGFIKVSPTQGAAPLTVAVEATVNTTNSCSAATYEVIFGDNSPSALINVPANSCKEVRQLLNHVYTGGGTYSVILRSGVHQTSATVVVTGSSGGGTPSTGGGAFSVTAGANGNPYAAVAQFDLTSSCARYDLDWGDGTSHSIQNEGSCAAGGVTKSLTHTYQNAGSYTITLRRGAQLETTDTVALVIVQ